MRGCLRAVFSGMVVGISGIVTIIVFVIIVVAQCTPPRIEIEGTVQLRPAGATSVITSTIPPKSSGGYVILEDETDKRLSLVKIEGLQDENGRFVLHVVLKPTVKLSGAVVTVRYYDKQDHLLNAISSLMERNPDGDYAVRSSTEIEFSQVGWFSLSWQGR